MTFPDATALDVGIRDAQTRDAITPDMDADMSQDAIARDVGDVGPFDAGPCDPTPRAPQPGDLVVNEILSDPAATIAGDANADGTRDSSDDEFVEIGNVSGSTLELSGVIVSDSAAQRHVFASRTLGCGDVVVVFGGGDPSGAAWNAHWVPASSGGLSLNNGGDRVRIGSSALNLEDLAFADYGSEADSDQSVVRERELDPTAALVQHRSVAPGRSFSPGVRSDGSAF
ncbi:MAG: lamin tail domain-containing protein [Deltaproteobacteria bacterium]|nr:lamin tail domain-containing protein [Deltaproteobacteria bacterium]